MSLSSSLSRVQYNGNGVTTVFDVPFRFLANADLEVILTSAEDVDTTQTLTTHYTVSGAGNPTGTVTMVTAPANGERLTIRRNLDALQPTQYPVQGGYQAQVIEESFDRATMLIQQLNELIVRSLTLPASTDITDLQLPVPEADHYLAWDGTGTALINALLATTALTVSSFIEPFLATANAAAARQALGENASGSFFSRKHNFSASAAPTANDDTGDGYAVGSWWFDTTNDNAYTCTDATLTAAVWRAMITDRGPAFKNRVTNGDVVIDQRNGGSAVTVNSNSTFYGPDMWRGFGVAADGVFTIARSASSPPAGFTHFLRATVTTADASIPASSGYLISTPFEGFDMLDLGFGAAGAQTVTLSFRVRSSLTGTFSGALRNGAGDRSYPFSFTINAANTWETKSITIAGDTSGTWPTDNTQWGLLQFDLGAGTSLRGSAGAWVGSNIVGVTGAASLIATLGATFDVTGVQLEIGAAATDFERISIGAKAIRCERYYQRMGEANTVFPYVFGYNTAGNGIYNSIPLPTRMRATPTVTVAGTWAVSNCGQPTVSGVTDRGLVLVIVCTGTGPALANPNGTDDYLTFTAEL